MKLPFAVYTARNGYAWQSGTEAGIAKLEQLRKAIGKMPEFDFGDSASSGMLNVGDEIVLYRFMRQEKADSHGRDALYLAMTFFPRIEARFINADEVLSAPPFSEPLIEPPSWFEYTGSAAVPFDFFIPAESATGLFDQTGSLAGAGFVFSKGCEGILRCSRNEPQDGRGAVFQYILPKSQPQETAFRIANAATPPIFVPKAKSNSASFWKLVAIGTVLLAVIEAVALIILVLERGRVALPIDSSAPFPAQHSGRIQPDESSVQDISSEQKRPEQPATEIQEHSIQQIEKTPCEEVESTALSSLPAAPLPAAEEMEFPSATSKLPNTDAPVGKHSPITQSPLAPNANPPLLNEPGEKETLND